MGIRFRTDSAHTADDAARLARGVETTYYDPPELEGIEPARPGDTWRVRWKATIEQEAQGISEGPIAGYAICCPKCLQVHFWTTALNCASLRPLPGGGSVCDHSGVGSCWAWTGSAEDGTLTASPSLHSVAEKGGCGWHGFLTNGELRG